MSDKKVPADPPEPVEIKDEKLEDAPADDDPKAPTQKEIVRMSEDSAHALLDELKTLNQGALKKIDSILKAKESKVPDQIPTPVAPTGTPAPKRKRSIFKPFFFPNDPDEE